LDINNTLSVLFNEIYSQRSKKVLNFSNILRALANASSNSLTIVNAELWKINIFDPEDNGVKFIKHNINNKFCSLVGFFGYEPDRNRKEEFIINLDNCFFGSIFRNRQESFYEYLLSQQNPSLITHLTNERIQKFDLERVISIPILKKEYIMAKDYDHVLNLYIRSTIHPEFIKQVSEFLFYCLYLAKEHKFSKLINSVITHFEQHPTNSRDTKSIVYRITDELREYLKFEACSVFIWDPIYHKLVLEKSTTSLKNFQITSYFPGEGKTGTVYKLGKALIIDDIAKDPYPQFKDPVTKEDTIHPAQSFMALPIVNSARPHDVLGVIRLVNKLNFISPNFVDYFSLDDWELVSNLCSHLALYLEFEQSERMRTAFARHMVHETLAPISAIRADIGRTIDKDYGKKLKEWQFKENLDLTIDNTNLLASITKNVDYIWKQSEGIPRSEIYKISEINNFSTEVLEKAIKMVLPMLRNNNLKFDNIIMEGGKFNLFIDGSAFTQIFINILSNSIKYKKLDSNHENYKITIKCHEPQYEGKIIIDIIDYGIGIKSESRNKIFFFGYRENDVIKDDVKGLGIGLTVVKKIINDFHSEIEVHNLSNPTIFRITLSGKLKNDGFSREAIWSRKKGIFESNTEENFGK